MANINKIRLSGQTYNIEDSNAPKTVELTQAQYDALAVKDPNTFYIITDAQGADLSQYYTSAQTESAITQAVSGKVDTSTYNTYTAATATALASKADTATTYTKTEVDTALASKQTTLTAGTGISIVDNVISATGGGGSSYSAGTGIDITNDVISVTGKVDTTTYETYTAATATAIGDKLAVSDFNTYSGTVDTAINSKASQSDLSTLSGTVTAHTANTDIHVTTAQTAAWNAKSDFSGSYNDLTDKPTIPTVPTSNTAFTNDAGYITSDAISGKADTSAVTESINAAVSGKVDTSTFNTYSGSVDTALSGKQDTLSAGTGIEISGNVISATGGGGTTYSGVSGITINNNNEIYYDGIYKTWLTSNHSDDYAVYWFKGSNSKIWIDNNTPTTSNSDSFRHQFSFGAGNNLKGSICGVAFGQMNTVKGFIAATFGEWNNSNNICEFASGQYNNSVSASATFGDSGNTLFSVGNGTAVDARHNAFEIRQNGDIYITSGGTDIKLQDNLGGGGASYSAGTGIDITNDVISVSGVVMSSAVTSAVTSGSTSVITSGGVYEALNGLRLVKITASDYANITPDSNTVYFVGDSNGYVIKIGSTNVS